MKLLFSIFSTLLLLNAIALTTQQHESWYWSWNCNERSSHCEKSKAPALISEHQHSEPPQQSLNLCLLTCGEYGTLWPVPTISTTFSRDQFIYFHPNEINFVYLNSSEESSEYLKKVANIFVNNLELECGQNCTIHTGVNFTVAIATQITDTILSFQTDESYKLTIITNGQNVWVQIESVTVFGARHALETLSQLITSYTLIDGIRRGLIMVASATIEDKPVYRHRGLLIDTARNYLPMNVIKRQLDAMAASKMNVLHWHATDSQSFPIVSERVSNLAKYGAYSSKEVYRLSDIRKLLRYAKYRGVRIILELDGPAHAGNGWQWGPDEGLGNLAVCVNKMPWREYCIQPPCGQMNPANPNLYNVLREFYKDITEIFPQNEFFHMGGDEVFINCWNTTQEIITYMEEKNLDRSTDDFLKLWAEFHTKTMKIYDEITGVSSTSFIIWSSQLTDPNIIEHYLPKDRYIIQPWIPSDNEITEELLAKGYRLIVSTKNAWYLDHGFWGSTKFYTWATVYNNRLSQNDLVLGGEVCMWGEYVDATSVTVRIWPRAAAAAERLWSNPAFDSGAVAERFYRHRERLITRGVDCAAVAPAWCYQNDGQCN